MENIEVNMSMNDATMHIGCMSNMWSNYNTLESLIASIYPGISGMDNIVLDCNSDKTLLE